MSRSDLLRVLVAACTVASLVACTVAPSADGSDSIQAGVAGAVLPAGNRVTNPSFEKNLSGWTSWQGTLEQVSTTAAPDGRWVVKVSWAAGTQYTLGDQPHTLSSISAGETYNAAAYVKAASPSAIGKSVVMVLRERTAVANAEVKVWRSAPVVLTHSFTRMSATAVGVASGDSLAISVVQSGAQNGDAFFVDAVSLVTPTTCIPQTQCIATCGPTSDACGGVLDCGPCPDGAGSPSVFGLSAQSDTAMVAAEGALGVQAGVVGVFVDWKTSFPTAAAANAARRGALLMISWEPQDWAGDAVNQPTYQLSHITRGDFDPYIQHFAAAAAATQRPVFVRWAAEMNGDWHTWSTGLNGNVAGDYAQAFRHVVTVARAAGGTNIKWMFNPIVSYPGSTPLSGLYPGSTYVDWAALDGYNFADLHPWGWQSFDTVYAAGLAEIASVAGDKPLAIAEIGCYPTPATLKAAWVTDSMSRARLAGVKLFVWFEFLKETDWRLSADPTVAAAARAALSQPQWRGGGDYQTTLLTLGL